MAETINVNDQIRFKPTEYGLKVRQRTYQNYGIEPEDLELDDDGYAYMNLWAAMFEFGQGMQMGFRQCIQGNRIELLK